MPQTKPIVDIVNVVASASVDQKIDLNEITRKFPEAEYHPEQFPGLVFRLKSPRTATLIFSSGKFVCTGSKSEKSAISAIKTVVQSLRKAKINIKNDPIIKIQNIVASVDLGEEFIYLLQQEAFLEACMNQNNSQASYIG